MGIFNVWACATIFDLYLENKDDPETSHLDYIKSLQTDQETNKEIQANLIGLNREIGQWLTDAWHYGHESLSLIEKIKTFQELMENSLLDLKEAFGEDNLMTIPPFQTKIHLLLQKAYEYLLVLYKNNQIQYSQDLRAALNRAYQEIPFKTF